MNRLLPLLPLIALLCLAPMAAAQEGVIRPGERWLDDRGRHIQAHGGGILRHGDAWYWFGEDRGRENERGKRYVSCYRSTDLVNWEFRNQVLAMAAPEGIPRRGFVLERPKVFYCQQNDNFVMYMHIDGALRPGGPGYQVAQVGVAVCDTIDGDYQFVRRFRPLGKESRDIGQFIDDDGTPYLIFEDRAGGSFHIAGLSDDCQDVVRDVCEIKANIEGGAIVRYDGLYYCVGSQLTGWRPNPNKYATAEQLEGPWSELRDIAPPEENTYGGQSSMLLKVEGSEATTVVLMCDQWRPRTQWDSRYLWMPVDIGDGRFRLPPPEPWTLDVTTGRSQLVGE